MGEPINNPSPAAGQLPPVAQAGTNNLPNPNAIPTPPPAVANPPPPPPPPPPSQPDETTLVFKPQAPQKKLLKNLKPVALLGLILLVLAPVSLIVKNQIGQRQTLESSAAFGDCEVGRDTGLPHAGTCYLTKCEWNGSCKCRTMTCDRWDDQDTDGTNSYKKCVLGNAVDSGLNETQCREHCDRSQTGRGSFCNECSCGTRPTDTPVTPTNTPPPAPTNTPPAAPTNTPIPFATNTLTPTATITLVPEACGCSKTKLFNQADEEILPNQVTPGQAIKLVVKGTGRNQWRARFKVHLAEGANLIIPSSCRSGQLIEGWCECETDQYIHKPEDQGGYYINYVVPNQTGNFQVDGQICCGVSGTNNCLWKD